jgi:outer membrane protein assembly factor BamB
MVSRVLRWRRAAISMVTALGLAAVLVPLAQGLPDDVPADTWGTNGRVNAIIQVGNVVYLGGEFTQVRENGGAGPGALVRNYIAAFDATTGAPLAGWDPSLNGVLYALAPSADGTRIYAGGSFTTVDGVARPRLVALDAATGEVDPQWQPKAPNGSVRALAVGPNRVYAGGGFIKVGSDPRQRLAAFDQASGALDPSWQPAADNMVRALALAPGASRVYAGGDFEAVSGLTRRRAVALDPASGTVAANWRPNPANRVFGLAADSESVYAAVGGDSNSLFAWDQVTAGQRWRKRSDGDFQALAVAGDTVYGGGHFNTFEGEPHRKLVAIDAATGALRRDWSPRLPHTTATWYGVSALSAHSDTHVSIGGDFDSVSGFRREHFAQFRVPSSGGSGGDPPPLEVTSPLLDVTAPLLDVTAPLIDTTVPSAPKDTIAPRLDARAKERQQVLRLRGVVAYVRCNEPCTITATGTLRIGGTTFELHPLKRAAQVTQRVRMKIRLASAARWALRRALARGRRPSVRVELHARDAARNRSRLFRASVLVAG